MTTKTETVKHVALNEEVEKFISSNLGAKIISLPTSTDKIL